jgi:putative oxidoreductase
MTPATPAVHAGGGSSGLRALYNRAAVLLTRLIGHDLLALAARLGIAGVFWL